MEATIIGYILGSMYVWNIYFDCCWKHSLRDYKVMTSTIAADAAALADAAKSPMSKLWRTAWVLPCLSHLALQ